MNSFASHMLWPSLGCALAAGCAHPTPSSPTPSDPGPRLPVVEYVTQQEILTPLPLRVRLPARYGAERVLVLYKTWGSRSWELLELDRAGQTWTGSVSCRDVSTVTGNTRYFFLALDGRGDVVVGSGSPEWPHVVTIVGSLPYGAQSLRGDAPPLRCHDPADCPPDMPGCPAYAFLRPPCHSDEDCTGGERCAWDGYCGAASTAELETNLTEPERLAAAIRAAIRHSKKTARAR
jgi:hypothetical protein